jgi:hypothetical protein
VVSNAAVNEAVLDREIAPDWVSVPAGYFRSGKGLIPTDGLALHE